MKRAAALISIALASCGSAEGTPHTEVAIAPLPTVTATATATASPPAELTAEDDRTGTIGLGATGNTGLGAGTGTGQGFGSGHGSLGGGHATLAPSIRQGTTTVTGALPPEVIQRIVRQNFGRFRLCYELGRQKDPKLAGTVTTRFVIDASGAVSKVDRDPSTTLPDPDVASCVVRGFSNLSFPQPASGIVTVVYPLTFAPAPQGP